MFRVKKSIKLGKGVRVNLGKKGISSLSVGGKGLTLNASKKGVKGTASLKGTGVSASGYLSKSSSNSSNTDSETSATKLIIWGLVIGYFLYLII